MSFSSDVKQELLGIKSSLRHCRIAELAAVINYCGLITASEDELILTIKLDNKSIYDKINDYLEKDFKIKKNEQINKNQTNYYIILKDQKVVKNILFSTGILHENQIKNKMNLFVLKSECCKRAYIRMCFILCGYVSNPTKYYHMEFVSANKEFIHDLCMLINLFKLNAKTSERKNNFIIYLKLADHIVDLLNIMGAYISLLELENLRVAKDIRNNINRLVNFEAANINKTVSAAVKQRADIVYIRNTKGLSYLPPHLLEVAEIRLSNVDISLKEIGELLDKPISKSGVNHRLKKINRIAEDLKNGTRA